MNHRDASRHLTHLIEGNLDPRTRADVSSHVARCATCRSWVETYRVLGGEFDTGSDGFHPDSHTLAWYAVSPQEIHDTERMQIAEHLEWCDVCRSDLDEVRSAIVDARPPMEARRPPARTAGRTFRLVAAAAVIAAAAGLVALVMRPAGPLGGAPERVSTGTAAAERVSDELSDVEIAGTRVIEGGDRVTLERVMISDGADVTIRAGNSVAFGNGFRVGNHARLHVKAGAALDANGTRRKGDPVGRDS